MKAIIFLFLVTLIISCNQSKIKNSESNSKEEEKSYLIDSLPTYVYHDTISHDQIIDELHKQFPSEGCDTIIEFNFQFEKNKSFPVRLLLKDDTNETIYCNRTNFPLLLSYQKNSDIIYFRYKNPYNIETTKLDTLIKNHYHQNPKKYGINFKNFKYRVELDFENSPKQNRHFFFNKIFEMYNSDIWDKEVIITIKEPFNKLLLQETLNRKKQ